MACRRPVRSVAGASLAAWALLLAACCCADRSPCSDPCRPTSVSPDPGSCDDVRDAKTWWISCREGDDCACKALEEPVVILTAPNGKPINFCCARGFAKAADAEDFIKKIEVLPGTQCVDRKKCPGCSK